MHEIKTLLEEDLIEESFSEWSSPIMLLPKPPDASSIATGRPNVRTIIDYRQVNNLCISEPQPLERIDSLIDRIAQSPWVSKFDLSKGYHQVKLTKRSRPITAFCAPGFPKYQWKRLPMGLKNSPYQYAYLTQKVLHGLEYCCGVYLDDIVIFSATWEDHLKHVKLVLERLKQAGLTVKLAKCYLGCQEIEYLGHMIGLGQMTPKDTKVKALLAAERPQNKKQLQSFLGFANYYSRYLVNYAQISAPLTDMLRKNKQFKWTDQAETSFCKIKSMLAAKPVLTIVNYDKQFYLFVDSSDVAIGAALMQMDDEGKYKPVCYFSKKLTDAQRKYCTTDKEALALVLSVRAFRVYMGGHVIVYSDHDPLRFMEKMAGASQRLFRWCMEVQPYNLEIRHVPGKDNFVADFLSRSVKSTNVEKKEVPSSL